VAAAVAAAVHASSNSYCQPAAFEVHWADIVAQEAIRDFVHEGLVHYEFDDAGGRACLRPAAERWHRCAPS